MRPRERRETGEQDLVRSRLAQFGIPFVVNMIEEAIVAEEGGVEYSPLAFLFGFEKPALRPLSALWRTIPRRYVPGRHPAESHRWSMSALWLPMRDATSQANQPLLTCGSLVASLLGSG